MTKCYLCGSEMEPRKEDRQIRVGNRRVTVEHEFLRCGDCGEDVLLPDQMERVQKKASAAIREKEGLLQPHEIRGTRRSFGLTQEKFEQLLGVGKKTVVRWERGTVFQSKAADSLIRLIRADPENARRLAEINGLDWPLGSFHECGISASLVYVGDPGKARGVGPGKLMLGPIRPTSGHLLAQGRTLDA